jgi:hypothetical protein
MKLYKLHIICIIIEFIIAFLAGYYYRVDIFAWLNKML